MAIRWRLAEARNRFQDLWEKRQHEKTAAVPREEDPPPAASV